MKKLKWFTLVELLIVIVIIGILMSALLPRLQGAQDIARDTSRQTALSQLQGWIVAYYSLNGKWPKNGSGNVSGAVSELEEVLRASNLMNSLPKEPNEANELRVGTGNKTRWSLSGDFYYEYMSKNGTKQAGLLLVAKTETPGKSNVKCSTLTWDDIKNFSYCKKIEIDSNAAENDPCKLKEENSEEYCYFLVY